MDQDAMDVICILQNKIVDQCERLQLQSASITKYVAEVLPGKNQRAVVGGSPSPLLWTPPRIRLQP